MRPPSGGQNLVLTEENNRKGKQNGKLPYILLNVVLPKHHTMDVKREKQKNIIRIISVREVEKGTSRLNEPNSKLKMRVLFENKIEKRTFETMRLE